jgi:hypothetical protein
MNDWKPMTEIDKIMWEQENYTGWDRFVHTLFPYSSKITFYEKRFEHFGSYIIPAPLPPIRNK